MLSVHGQMAEQSPALNNTQSQASPFSNCATSTRTEDEFIYYLCLLWQYLHVQVKLCSSLWSWTEMPSMLCKVFIQTLGRTTLKWKS